jgi:dinuclear metal center YbgI/SA1388 family protein
MTMLVRELVEYLNALLRVDAISDHCPNGLQVEGRPEVIRVLGGVTACQALIDAAIEWEADALLVHHGYFWNNEPAPIIGMKRRRLKTLLTHDISLLAYHLPLDVHPDHGNNASLARLLGFSVTGPLEPQARFSVGLQGVLAEPMSADDVARRLTERLGRAPLHIPSGDPRMIRTLGWCTGAAQSLITQAAMQGLDAFISGEISEPTAHVAREGGIHYFAAGHHATERCGVQALGAHIQARFGLEFKFVDIDNPA